MKAMILAAGRGKRMRPLSDTLPKPLLIVKGKPLIEHHVINLVRSGITDIVVNCAYLGALIVDFLEDGAKWGANIRYSHEDQALETGGGIKRALPMLGEAPFLIVNGDVWIDMDFKKIPAGLNGVDAHLYMVKNPGFHVSGDFYLDKNDAKVKLVSPELDSHLIYTYCGVSLLSPQLFSGTADGRFPLLDLLKKAIEKGRVTGEVFMGGWCDVGTPERLGELNKRLDA